MANPKHKIFFGAPDKKPSAGKYSPVPPSLPPVVPCWTWDTSEAIFSGEKKGFDCDYDVDTLANKIINTSGFTWDNNVVTMDTDTKIYN